MVDKSIKKDFLKQNSKLFIFISTFSIFSLLLVLIISISSVSAIESIHISGSGSSNDVFAPTSFGRLISDNCNGGYCDPIFGEFCDGSAQNTNEAFDYTETNVNGNMIWTGSNPGATDNVDYRSNLTAGPTHDLSGQPPDGSSCNTPDINSFTHNTYNDLCTTEGFPVTENYGYCSGGSDTYSYTYSTDGWSCSADGDCGTGGTCNLLDPTDPSSEGSCSGGTTPDPSSGGSCSGGTTPDPSSGGSCSGGTYTETYVYPTDGDGCDPFAVNPYCGDSAHPGVCTPVVTPHNCNLTTTTEKNSGTTSNDQFTDSPSIFGFGGCAYDQYNGCTINNPDGTCSGNVYTKTFSSTYSLNSLFHQNNCGSSSCQQSSNKIATEVQTCSNNEVCVDGKYAQASYEGGGCNVQFCGDGMVSQTGLDGSPGGLNSDGSTTGTCSNNPGLNCTTDTDCGSGNTCVKLGYGDDEQCDSATCSDGKTSCSDSLIHRNDPLISFVVGGSFMGYCSDDIRKSCDFDWNCGPGNTCIKNSPQAVLSFCGNAGKITGRCSDQTVCTVTSAQLSDAVIHGWHEGYPATQHGGWDVPGICGTGTDGWCRNIDDSCTPRGGIGCSTNCKAECPSSSYPGATISIVNPTANSTDINCSVNFATTNRLQDTVYDVNFTLEQFYSGGTEVNSQVKQYTITKNNNNVTVEAIFSGALVPTSGIFRCKIQATPHVAINVNPPCTTSVSDWLKDIDKDGYVSLEQGAGMDYYNDHVAVAGSNISTFDFIYYGFMKGDCADWPFNNVNVDSDYTCPTADLQHNLPIPDKDPSSMQCADRLSARPWTQFYTPCSADSVCENLCNSFGPSSGKTCDDKLCLNRKPLPKEDKNNNGINDYASCAFYRNPGAAEDADNIDNNCGGHCQGSVGVFYEKAVWGRGRIMDSSFVTTADQTSVKICINDTQNISSQLTSPQTVSGDFAFSGTPSIASKTLSFTFDSTDGQFKCSTPYSISNAVGIWTVTNINAPYGYQVLVGPGYYDGNTKKANVFCNIYGEVALDQFNGLNKGGDGKNSPQCKDDAGSVLKSPFGGDDAFCQMVDDNVNV